MRSSIAFALVLSALLAAAGAWAGQGAPGHGRGSAVAEDPGLQRLRGLHQGKGLQGLRSLHTGKGLESIRGLHLGKGIEGLPGRGGASGKGAERRHHFTGDDVRFRRDVRDHRSRGGFHRGHADFPRHRRLLHVRRIVVVSPLYRSEGSALDLEGVSVPSWVILQALEANAAHRWTDRATGAEVTVTPTWTHREPEGVFCHEYRVDVTRAGRSRTVDGQACRYPDGVWQVGG